MSGYVIQAGWPITKLELHKKDPKKLELQKNEPSKLELHKLEPITKKNFITNISLKNKWLQVGLVCLSLVRLLVKRFFCK